MGLEYLKRWHWAVIGLILGLVFGGSQVMFRETDPGGDRTFDRRQFEAYLARGMQVQNLVLHPTLDGQEWITGEVFKHENGSLTAPAPRRVRRPGRRLWPRMSSAPEPAPVTQPAEVKQPPGTWVPFPVLAAEANSKQSRYEKMNGREYIEYLKKEYPQAADMMTYRFAWWEVPKYTLSIYGGAGVLLVGGVWPTIIALLTGAGLGRAKKEEDTYDLSRFKGKTAKTTAAAVDHTQGDQELAELNAKLEAGVVDMLTTSTTPDIDHDEEEAHAIRKLENRPMDATESALGKSSDDPKDYNGEFYPVVRPGGKK